MPALAVATCAVVAVSVVGLNRGDEQAVPGLKQNNDTSRDSGGAAEQAPQSVAPSPVPPPTDQDFAPGRERRIERSARMSLQVPEDRLERVGAGHRGHRPSATAATCSARRSDRARTQDGGTYELRVPAADLRAALRDLGRLGTVRSQSQTGQDVTAGYVSAADRLQSARAERRSLLRRLERSGSDAQTEALRRQLELNAGQVSALRGRLRDLRVRTDYAAVSLTLGSRDRTGAPRAAAGTGWAARWMTRWRRCRTRSSCWCAPWAWPSRSAAWPLLAWLAARSVRRRRRDAALS